MLSSSGWLAAPRLVRVVVRAYQWTGDTHYSVLGVKQDASPREIKMAYLALSKQLHPDMNQNIEDGAKSLAVHQNYVRVTQAYSVLGNRKDRAVYDLQLEGRREGEAGYTPSTTAPSTTTTRDDARFMTFEERARHMGFQPQDPDYYKKHGNYHRKVVVACVVWIVLGIAVQGIIIMRTYDRHTVSMMSMDPATKRNSQLLTEAREKARKWGSFEEQREEMARRWKEEQPRLHTPGVKEGPGPGAEGDRGQ